MSNETSTKPIDFDGLLESVKDADTTPTQSRGGFNLLDGIEDNLESQGKAWIPQDEGDTIVGFVTSVGTIWSDQSKEDVPLIGVKDREGEDWSVRGYGKVLVNQIEKANPQVGDGIAIRFNGRKKNRSGTAEYKDFVVKTVKAS